VKEEIPSGKEGIISAKEDGRVPFSLPQDPRPAWVVGVTAFKSGYLSIENHYLLHSVPLLLKESLERLTIHNLSAEERDAYRKHLLDLAWQEFRRKQELAQKNLDERLFLHPDERTAKEYDEKREVQKVYNWIKSLDYKKIPFPESKEVVFKPGEDAGSLLCVPLFSPGEFAKKHNLDLLIWGEIEEIQGYLYIRVNAFHSLLDKNIYSYEDAAEIGTLFEALPDTVRELTRVILGRDWASLTVRTDPSSCDVRINNVWVGMGGLQEQFVDPGELRVEVSCPGFVTEELSLDIAPLEEKVLQIDLVPTEERQLFLTSVPEGAEVYLDALWAGQTPLVLTFPNIDGRLLLKKEGYRDMSYMIAASSSNVLNMVMKKHVLDEEAWQKKRRDNFYKSLGIFALSVPLPLFLYSFAVDNAYARSRTIPASYEYRKFEKRTELLYYGYLGTMFVSITLFLNMGFDLLDYVNHAF
jgi:hypothetical protein